MVVKDGMYKRNYCVHVRRGNPRRREDAPLCTSVSSSGSRYPGSAGRGRRDFSH